MHFTPLAPTRHFATIATAMTCIAILSGCTRDGNSDPMEPTSLAISGYAASGRALPTGSTVSANCLEGQAQTTTANDGSFSLDADDLTFPCLLQAEFGSGESTQRLHSFAATAGIVQITPLTHASIARALADNDPAAVFAAPSESQWQKLAAELPDAQAKLRDLLSEQNLATSSSAASGSFFTMPLVPATANNPGDAHDLLLDTVMAHFGGTDALVFTLVHFIPGRLDTLQPPPTPKTGLTIAPAPIVLGALSYSFTNEEAIAATRMVSITNHGPESQSIAPYFIGYQNGTITSTQFIEEAKDNQPACFYGRTLAPGTTCWVRLYWKPGNVSDGVPLSGSLEGRFGVRLPNTMTELVGTPVTAELVSRSYIQGGIAVFPGSSGYKVRNLLTLRNVGDATGSYSIVFSSNSSAPGAFYEDPTRPGQKTCTGSLAPGDSCTIPYAFCWSYALGEDERIRATLIIQGNTINTEVELIASNRQSEPPRQCGDQNEEL